MKPDGGPAFPIAAYTLDTTGHPMLMVKDGMTLRDYFAAKAMSALCQRNEVVPRNWGKWINEEAEELVGDAYRLADAMLAERDK